MANIAFKMNYCDGGINNINNKDSKNIGFNGICSDEMIEYNIELQKNAWCSNEICLCFYFRNLSLNLHRKLLLLLRDMA